MPFRVYSTESGQIETFEPISPRQAKMYICGPTVYNLIHIGHARSYILFDIIRRWLEYSGYDVIHVQNFSDVEESILKMARKLGKTPEEVADLYIEEFFKDADRLNLKRAHSYPTYSENVPVMIRIVQDLLDSGIAYRSGSDVYFRTEGGSGFGRLSHVDPRDSVADGLDLPEGRENPFDFVLWRGKKREGEPSWDSPWGEGRPGWHVGCYAMSSGYLGRCFDIHGGGLDLIFPHHESILLVSEAHADQPICNYFVHNSFVTLGRKKMSKSLGNFVTVRQLSDDYGGEAIRLYVLKHHYRDVLDYDESGLEETAKELDELRTKLESICECEGIESPKIDPSSMLENLKSRFEDAMNDDLHTDEALKAFTDLTDYAHVEAPSMSKEGIRDMMEAISRLSAVLGIFADFEFP